MVSQSARPVRRRSSAEQYAASVEVAKEYILAGDAFQVVLAQRFDLDLDAEAFDLYRALRRACIDYDRFDQAMAVLSQAAHQRVIRMGEQRPGAH